jgi:hypothetical protein
MKGFSDRNLYRMKLFYLFYTQDDKFSPQLVAKSENANSPQLGANLETTENFPQVGGKLETNPIFQIPWGHHSLIIAKCKSVQEALFYVQKTIEGGWSRAVLMNFLAANLYAAQGKALSNFTRLLPEE